MSHTTAPYRNRFAIAIKKALAAAIPLSLSLVLALNPLAVPLYAEADEATTTGGTVTIAPIDDNEGVTYQAIKIFSGTVVPGESTSGDSDSQESVSTTESSETTSTDETSDSETAIDSGSEDSDEADTDSTTSSDDATDTSGENTETDNSTTSSSTSSSASSAQSAPSLGYIQWASNDVKTAVEDVLTSQTWNGGTYATGSTAQDAAEFIRDHIGGNGSGSTDSQYVLKSSELGNRLAAAVQDLTPTYTGIKPGKAVAFEPGYYLIVTEKSSLESSDGKQIENQRGTAPIFLIAGKDDVTVTQKTGTVPQHDKKVMDDSANSDQPDVEDEHWGYVADAQVGQNLWYQQEATLPSTYDAYSSYKLVFHDQLSDGLKGVKDSVRVLVVNGTGDSKSVTTLNVGSDNITSELTDKGAWTVTINDLRKITKGEGDNTELVNGDTRIYVQYQAQIVSDNNAVCGGTGNANTAYLEYSNNPNRSSTGRTEKSNTHVFTYALTLHKQDANTDQNLAGARFTIQANNPDDQASKDLYVQEDGTLGDTPYEFTSDNDGNIKVSGLDVGTYTLKETNAPDGYHTVPDATFEIRVSYKTGKSEQSINALHNLNVQGGNDLIAGQLVFAGLGSSDKDAIEFKNDNAKNGLYTLTAEDMKTVDMPFTGQQGIALSGGAGALIAGTSLASILRCRKDRINPSM